jgi:hypothetical protein
LHPFLPHKGKIANFYLGWDEILLSALKRSPRIKPIENEGARASDVQKARRRGREADSNH